MDLTEPDPLIPGDISQRIAFEGGARRDTGADMSSPAPRPFPEDHPLRDDPARLEAIADLMWIKIQKTIQPGRQPRRRTQANTDLTLVGGISTEQVLYQALAALLYFEPDRLRSSWEGLAVQIAHHKAVQAVRDNTRGRRTDDDEDDDEVHLSSLDAPGADGVTLGQQLPDPSASTESEAAALAQQMVYRRIAEEILTARDREIYFRRHNLGETFAAMKDDFDLTEQRLGQIYMDSAKKVHAAAKHAKDLQ